MKIIQKFITKDDSYRNNVNKVDSRYTTFQKRGPLGLMLHSVGTPQPDALVFANGWNRPGREASVHAVLQEDGTVYQTMPWNFRAWHAGGSANNTHCGIEMTESGYIRYTGGANFTCSNLVAARTQAIGCYKTAVELFAYLCMLYHLDPMTDIISHAEGAKKGIASNHGDPEHYWRGLELSFTMDTFRKAVAAKIQETEDTMTKEEVVNIVKEELKKYKVEIPPVTQEEVIKALGDKWIHKFTDLPEWAKKEVRELIEMGALKGVQLGEKVEDTVIDATLNSYIRPIIVSYRAAKKLLSDLPADKFREQIRIVMNSLSQEN